MTLTRCHWRWFNLAEYKKMHYLLFNKIGNVIKEFEKGTAAGRQDLHITRAYGKTN